MIEYIQGRLVEKYPTHAVIDCAGVGYLLNITLNTFGQLGDSENCKLFAHQVIREDAHLLYGFSSREERTLFLHLISVSGVGASTARMILSAMTPAETQRAILEGDVNALKAIKGIGAKSAQRLIVDLRDKLGKSEILGEIPLGASNTTKEEALSALLALGFDKKSAEKALLKAVAEAGDDYTLEGLIKNALKYL